MQFCIKNCIQSHSLLGVNVLVLQVVNFRVRLSVYAVALFECYQIVFVNELSLSCAVSLITKV